MTFGQFVRNTVLNFRMLLTGSIGGGGDEMAAREAARHAEAGVGASSDDSVTPDTVISDTVTSDTVTSETVTPDAQAPNAAVAQEPAEVEPPAQDAVKEKLVAEEIAASSAAIEEAADEETVADDTETDDSAMDDPTGEDPRTEETPAEDHVPDEAEPSTSSSHAPADVAPESDPDDSNAAAGAPNDAADDAPDDAEQHEADDDASGSAVVTDRADAFTQGALDLDEDPLPPEIHFEAHGRVLALTAALEALLFVSDTPVDVGQFAKALNLSPAQIDAGLERLALLYRRDARGLRLMDRGGRFQLVTMPEAAGIIEDYLNLDLSTRLSGPALETLAVIAYRQPVTRAQVEAVRGVDCSGVLRSLLQRGLIEDAGRLETVGRPILYSVTDLFMQHFGLTGMNELPELKTDEADTLWAATELALDGDAPVDALPDDADQETDDWADAEADTETDAAEEDA